MAKIVISLVIGLLSIIVELLIPGFGFFGIVGFAAAAISFGICFLWYGIAAVIAELAITLVFLGFIFMYLKKYKFHGKIILDDNVKKDNTNKEDYYKNFIGKTGMTKTPLKPCGNVKFENDMIEAFSDGNFIDSNREVTATKVSDNKLYVEEK